MGPVALGLGALIGRAAVCEQEGQSSQGAQEEEVNAFDENGFAPYETAEDGPLAGHLAGLEAISQRTNRLLSELAARPPESRDPMVYDLDWDENARMASWREAVGSTENMPSLLAGTIALLAWEEIEPLQHRACWQAHGRRNPQGSLSNPVASSLREHGPSRDRTRSAAGARFGDQALAAVLDGFAEAARRGMKEHDRWLLARRQLDRRLVGRRSNSSLPALADLVVARPICLQA